MRLLTWNLEWAKLSSWRAAPILERLRSEDADVAVLTEAQVPLVQQVYDHVVDAGPHPRSRQPEGSKVVVASRYPIEVVDLVGSPDLPPHNFVAVDIELPELGPLRVIGVAVRWKEKRTYVDALPDALARLVTDRTVLAGDFNMTMTRGGSLEHDLASHLDDVGLRVVTAGDWDVLAGQPPLIDHVAVSSTLAVSDVHVWGRHVDGEQRRISDHAGVAVDVTPTGY